MENGLVVNFVGIILMVWNQEICAEKVGVMCNIALTAWYCISGIAGKLQCYHHQRHYFCGKVRFTKYLLPVD